MASGTIILAHDSGGPKLDIVKDFKDQKTGFCARCVTTYSEAISEILNLSPDERMSIRANARESVVRFSDSEFEASFLSATESLLSNM
jgi:alpha-1,2-mannosyltransferase